MAYSLVETSIPARSADLPWEENGPGLYQLSKRGAPAPESVVELDSGERVALSVEAEYRDNDLAIHLCGYARLIEADGSSTLSPDGVAMETSCSVAISNASVVARGLPTYKAEVLKLLMGEPPTMINETTHLMWVGDEQRLTSNIRNAIASLAALHDGGQVTAILSANIDQ